MFITPRFKVSILDRYLFVELVQPFIFGVCAFSSIGLAIGSLFDIVKKVAEAGLPFDIAFKVLLFKMPEFVVYSFPMSMLLATLIAYGRLSADSELIALRSVGISVYRLVVPALILSILVTGLTFLFHELIVPQANYQATLTLERALEEDNPTFKQENILYSQYEDVELPNGEEKNVLKRLFYAEEFDGQEMRGLTVIDRSEGEINQIITASSANWNIKENQWDFYNGTIYIIDDQGSYRNIIRFEHQQLQLPRSPLDIAKKGDKHDSEMNIGELREWIKTIEVSGNDERLEKLRVRLQQKYALPFICIVFGLVGSALGTRPQNTSKATSFGVSILIIFSYYLFGFVTEAMGIVGVLSPFTAAWLPNLFGFGAGVILLVQSSK